MAHVAAALALQLALRAARAEVVDTWGHSPLGGSEYGYECGEAIQLESDKENVDGWGDYYHYLIGMASETTFVVAWSDKYLQRSRAFHPMKCRYHVEINGSFYEEGVSGRLLLLQNACYLKNSFDVLACYRREYFDYPVKPNADTVKHCVEVNDEWSGLQVEAKGRSQVFARPESDQQRAASELLEDGVFALEVCAFVGECKPHHGLCQPSFWLVAEYYGSDPWSNAWKDYSSQTFHPYMPLSEEVAQDWRQVHSTPEYGPYPHCPTDSTGRAARCVGNETLTVNVKSFAIKVAEITEGNDFMLKVAYELEWGDRFAVHPCTIDLFRVNTRGRQLRVASELFWTPTLIDLQSEKPMRVLGAPNTLGVSLDFGMPVTQPINTSKPWPKQLVLSRTYEVEFFPSPSVDWRQYPYDTQKLKLNLALQSVNPKEYQFNFGPSAFDNSDEIDVGDSWKFKSVEVGTAVKDGRSVLSATVTVQRNARSKIYSLFLPAISFAMLDSVGHILMPYDDYANLFAVQALMIGTSIAMLDPGFLGIPSTLNSMPFMQCFMLMLVVGALKTSLLIIGRLFFARRITRTEQKLEQKLEGEADPGLQAHLERLRWWSFIYDIVLKSSVPLWYLVSWPISFAIYGV